MYKSIVHLELAVPTPKILEGSAHFFLISRHEIIYHHFHFCNRHWSYL